MFKRNPTNKFILKSLSSALIFIVLISTINVRSAEGPIATNSNPASGIFDFFNGWFSTKTGEDFVSVCYKIIVSVTGPPERKEPGPTKPKPDEAGKSKCPKDKKINLLIGQCPAVKLNAILVLLQGLTPQDILVAVGKSTSGSETPTSSSTSYSVKDGETVIIEGVSYSAKIPNPANPTSITLTSPSGQTTTITKDSPTTLNGQTISISSLNPSTTTTQTSAGTSTSSTTGTEKLDFTVIGTQLKVGDIVLADTKDIGNPPNSIYYLGSNLMSKNNVGPGSTGTTASVGAYFSTGSGASLYKIDSISAPGGAVSDSTGTISLVKGGASTSYSVSFKADASGYFSEGSLILNGEDFGVIIWQAGSPPGIYKKTPGSPTYSLATLNPLLTSVLKDLKFTADTSQYNSIIFNFDGGGQIIIGLSGSSPSLSSSGTFANGVTTTGSGNALSLVKTTSSTKATPGTTTTTTTSASAVLVVGENSKPPEFSVLTAEGLADLTRFTKKQKPDVLVLSEENMKTFGDCTDKKVSKGEFGTAYDSEMKPKLIDDVIADLKNPGALASANTGLSGLLTSQPNPGILKTVSDLTNNLFSLTGREVGSSSGGSVVVVGPNGLENFFDTCLAAAPGGETGGNIG